jgi:hypothetical protein
MNSNIGSEQSSSYTHPNGATSTSGTSQAGRASSGGGQASSQSSGGGSQMDSLVQTAQRITSQMVKSPYSLPIAIGGAAFVLGALASSKILRQLVLVAGAYAVKYAMANAPKDEMLEFAKNFVKTSIAQPQSAS